MEGKIYNADRVKDITMTAISNIYCACLNPTYIADSWISLAETPLTAKLKKYLLSPE
jgi:hypothetical protein